MLSIGLRGFYNKPRQNVIQSFLSLHENVTPFERRESSSSLIYENSLFASKEWLFVDLGEQELGVAAITE